MATKNSNLQGTKGFVYQFWTALQLCFELQPKEQLLIETEGDLSVSGRVQIELKHYNETKNLTNSDLNIWNTLKNWMDDSFDYSKYRYLVLRTTQPMGPKSIFENWNKKDSDKRLEIVRSYIELSENTFQNNLKKPKTDPPESLRLMRIIINHNQPNKLFEILSRFQIATESPDFTETHNELKHIQCKGIPQANQDAFLSALVGYVIRPDVVTHENWSISYEDFKIQVEEATAKYNLSSKRFPQKYRSEFNAPLTKEQEELQNNLFVQKIKEIDHDSQIHAAIKDYSFAFQLTLEYFQKYSVVFNDYQIFEGQVNREFQQAFARAQRQSNRCSKTFYDDHTLSQPPHMSGFMDTPKDFRNGVLHIQMNNSKESYRWKLDH